MNDTTRADLSQEENGPLEIEAMSVYRVLDQVTDGRAKRGVRYPLAFVLTLIVLGKLAGMTTPEAIAHWVSLRAKWLRRVLPCPRESFPCTST